MINQSDLKNNLSKIQLSISGLFVILGFSLGTWATRLPALKTQFGASDSEVGFLILAAGFGSISAFPMNVALIKRIGSRSLAYLASVLLPIFLLLLVVTPSYELGLIIMFVQGACGAALNFSMNSQAAKIEELAEEKIMLKLHACFSFGLFMSAIISSAVLFFSDDLIVHFGISALLMWITIFMAKKHLLPTQGEQSPSSGKRFAFPTKAARNIGTIVFFGAFIEASIHDWSALYLREIAGAGENVAPLGIAIFSLAMICVRLKADSWRTRFGDEKIVFAGGLVTCAGMVMGLTLGGTISGIAAFAIVGLGVAAIVPCMYAKAAKFSSTEFAGIVTLGSIGFLVGPPVIGFISDAVNLSAGMWLVAAAGFAASCLSFGLVKLKDSAKSADSGAAIAEG